MTLSIDLLLIAIKIIYYIKYCLLKYSIEIMQYPPKKTLLTPFTTPPTPKTSYITLSPPKTPAHKPFLTTFV